MQRKLEQLKAKVELDKKKPAVAAKKAEDKSNVAEKEQASKPVTKMLEERTKKTQKERNPDEPKRKLTHVKSFVLEKTAGSIEYKDGDVAGRSLRVTTLNAS